MNRMTPYFRPQTGVWAMSLALLASLLISHPGAARADGTDDDYLTISGMIDEGDSLRAAGHTAEAHAKYSQAREYLDTFHRDNPDWNPMTVSLRLRQLAEKSDQTLPGASAPVAPTLTNVTGAPAPASPSAPVKSASPVQLLSNGSEPRQLLRLHPAVGDEQQADMTMQIGMTVTMGGKALPATDLPTMDFSWALKVSGIEPDGDIDYQMRIQQVTLQTNTSLPAAAIKTIQGLMSGLDGALGTGRVSPAGVVQDFNFHAPNATSGPLAQSLDQMKESFRNSFQALPEEPVGPGARWNLQSHVKSGGMTMDQTLTSQLDAVDGDHLSLSVDLLQTAAPQRIVSPSLPGVSMNLQKLSGIGHGKNEQDLSHLSPTSSVIEENMEMDMSMNQGKPGMSFQSQTHIKAALVAR